MKLTTFAQLGRRSRRLVWGVTLTGLMLAAGTTAIGDVHPDAKRLADQRRESFSLFAGPTAVLQGNQLQCGLTNDGNGTCTDIFNSPTGGGGFWPTGSPNQYIFNTGIQFAAIIGADGGPWANDTVGAFFFDASGRNPSGTAVTNIFDSLNPDDLDNWPAAAFVDDPDLFQDVLVGRRTASQQDSWMQYWDGDPSKISGRQHPMGVTVTSRSLAWNYPAGNESLIYFIFTVENSTADLEFQRLNEAQFFAGADALPNAGYTLTESYGAFATDMDVTANAGQNYSTVILPFDLGLSYHGGFDAPTFEYSPALFFPPFFTEAPGLIGIKYLRSPINPATGTEVGLTLFSVTLNSATGFPDPSNDRQLWRYLSGAIDPSAGDFPCSVTPEVVNADPALQQRSICFLTETAADTRFYQASGPFDVAPGQNAKIVVAYIAAATVATLPDGSPSGISANDANANANPPGIASFHPGFPSARGCTDATATSCTEVDNANPVKVLERGAGWVSYTGPPPANALEGPAQKIDQFQVQFVPGSLLGKALVAQTIFDSKFLLGFAPEQPVFGVVPGDNAVTVIWQPSISEDLTGEGDPFFAVSSDPGSALFNPNYKQFDVEGYRIWRGTNAGNLTLVAQFDYATTQFTDFTCETVVPGEDVADFSASGTPNPNGDGFVGGDVCPADFTKISPINGSLQFNNGTDGGSPGGGVVRLASGAAFASNLTTVIVDDPAGEKTGLADSGVPFSFVDSSVTNNFTYFYAVSAFDVNSQASGPHSLRSARVAKATVPRADAPNLLVDAGFSQAFLGGDGQPLDINAPLPTLDPDDGTWSGPFPPSAGQEFTLAVSPFNARLLSEGSVTVKIDSVLPIAGSSASALDDLGACVTLPNGRSGNPWGNCWVMFLTATSSAGSVATTARGYNPWWNAFGEPGAITVPLITPENAVKFPFDRETLDAFGVDDGFALATADVVTAEAQNNASAEGAQNRRYGNFHGGARWFDGDSRQGATEVPDGAAYDRVGAVTGADVFAPISHTPANDIEAADTGLPWANNTIMFSRQCFNRGMSYLDHAADLVFAWSGGTVTVEDATYNSVFPFSGRAAASWGFLTDDANGNGVLDWHDFNYIDGAIQNIRPITGGNCDPFNGTGFDAGGTATPVSLVADLSGGLVPTSTDIDSNVDLENGAPLPQTGTGFGLYVAGHRFIFETGSVPADGTTWTLRTFNGNMTTSSGDVADPSGYAYSGDIAGGGVHTPVLVPGLTMQWTVSDRSVEFADADLSRVHTVPDPYLGTSLYDLSPTSKQLMFVNLPPEATIRIFTLTGVLVDVLIHDDITAGGRAVWDVRNRNNQFVASGVYFYHVVTPAGDEHVGKFTIINQAGSN